MRYGLLVTFIVDELYYDDERINVVCRIPAPSCTMTFSSWSDVQDFLHKHHGPQYEYMISNVIPIDLISIV